MSARVFAVVTLTDVDGKLNAAGQEVVDRARHSNDGLHIILDFNHHRAAIDGLFNTGVDVDAVINGCIHLTHSEAIELVKLPLWANTTTVPKGL